MKKRSILIMFSILICCNFSLNAQTKFLSDMEFDQLKPYYSIEEALVNPDSVQVLYLIFAKLTTVPKEVVQFKNLIFLEMGHNNIKEIPDYVFKLKKLQYLGLSHNQISKIPDDISNLKDLTTIKCWNNNLTEIPDALLNLPNLKVLELKGNPIPKEEKKRILKEYPDIKIKF